ncbi:hypothetical protein D5F01_LYC22727 [Larimichthys crocea]|uniref:Uncharacterized protein n=1 Tax=Larimichthys crocea TaxID=215358 RepID=A0A6G0HJD4_LARCR|nr:hypothetical protein D5F01_LYC22727 [Larimichthys crocea]
MDLINWSLNAIDTIFSTRSPGSGEPVCPAGTFAAGYSMDAWEKWRVVCLAALSVEDVEDIFLFGLLMTSVLLIGAGMALIHRGMRKMLIAVQSPITLPAMIEALSRAVGNLNEAVHRNADNIGVLDRNNVDNITALKREVEDITETMNRNMDTITGSMENIKNNQDMGYIMEKLTVLQRQMDRFGDQAG